MLFILIVKEELKKKLDFLSCYQQTLCLQHFLPPQLHSENYPASGFYAGLSISPAPDPDLLDKPRQTSSLCKWLESLFKHWHQLETLYARLCVTRQGFPDATNTNIDSHKLIPQRLATSQKTTNADIKQPIYHLFQGLAGGVSSA